MKYKIETEIDPEKWNMAMFNSMKKAAITVKYTLINNMAKKEADRLFNKIRKDLNYTDNSGNKGK